MVRGEFWYQIKLSRPLVKNLPATILIRFKTPLHSLKPPIVLFNLSLRTSISFGLFSGFSFPCHFSERDFSTQKGNPTHTQCLFSLSHAEHNKQHKPHIIYPNNETLTMGALIARFFTSRTGNEQRRGGFPFCAATGISTSTIISIFRILRDLQTGLLIQLTVWHSPFKLN